jgi:hypothetical protein
VHICYFIVYVHIASINLPLETYQIVKLETVPQPNPEPSVDSTKCGLGILRIQQQRKFHLSLLTVNSGSLYSCSSITLEHRDHGKFLHLALERIPLSPYLGTRPISRARNSCLQRHGSSCIQIY